LKTESVPVPAGSTGETNPLYRILPRDLKSQYIPTRNIFRILQEKGFISDNDVFDQFANRKIAVEWIGWATSGRFRILNHYPNFGKRIYVLTERGTRIVRELAV